MAKLNGITIEGKPSKSGYHKDYAVTFTIKPPHQTVTLSIATDFIKDCFKSMAAIRQVWLVPEVHPSSGNYHYHGIISIKDMRGWPKVLKRLELYGSFHLHSLTDREKWEEYCIKDIVTHERESACGVTK